MLTRSSCTYTQFRFHRQFCSWVSSHVGIPVVSSLEEELSRLGNTRGPYSSRAEKTKQSTTNDSLLPTAGKEDSVPPCINDGRSPGWCWQGVNGRPRAFLSSHRLQPAGRSLLGALPWFSAPAVRGRHFCSIPRVLEIKRFLSLSPVKQQAVSPPPHHQTTDRAALRERCGFRSGLEFWCRGFC